MGAAAQSATSLIKTSPDRHDSGGWTVDTRDGLREINN